MTALPVLLEWLEGVVQTPMVSLTKNLIRFLNESASQVGVAEDV